MITPGSERGTVLPPSASNALGREQIRLLNQRAILNAIHRHGRISRSDLAVDLSLSPAAVSAITGSFIEAGLVVEAEVGVSTSVGRKPILLEVDYDNAWVVGIKVSNVAVTSALTNLNAEVVQAETKAITATDPTTVIEEIARAFERHRATSEKAIGAVGVNLPGIVDADQRNVRHSPLLGWDAVALGDSLVERLGVPVLVENDVNALALAESWYGHGREHQNFLVLTLGRGVGLGIVLNGELYRGPNGGAGEIGHMLIDANGPESRHAEKGTLEAYISDDALLREARSRVSSFDPDSTAEQLAELARTGDSEANAIYEEAGHILGRALSNLVNILAPSLIVLSGEGMRAAEFLLPSAKAELERRSFGDLAEHLELVVDPWGDDAWARGAAGLAASRYLTNAATSMGGDQAPDTGGISTAASS